MAATSITAQKHPRIAQTLYVITQIRIGEEVLIEDFANDGIHGPVNIFAEKFVFEVRMIVF